MATGLRERAAAAVADAERREAERRAAWAAGEEERQREWARRALRERLRVDVPDIDIRRRGWGPDFTHTFTVTIEGDEFWLYSNSNRIVLAARYSGCSHWWESHPITSDLTLGYAYQRQDIEAGGPCWRCQHSY